MNTPSPLVPQGAFQDKGKSHVRITVFAILAVHVVLLGVLLIAGCNKKTATDTAETPVPPPSNEWPVGAPGNPPTSPQSNDAVIAPVPPPTGVAAGTSAPPVETLVPVPTHTGVLPPVPTGVTPGPADTGALKEHTIAKGETLATIGKKYGVGYKAIEAANPGISPTRLKIGDKIKIPEKAGAGTATAAPAVATDPSGATVYVVRSGDNLLKISKTTGVPVKTLRAANNLKTDQIRVGQKLKIPARAVAPAESTAPPVAPPVPPPGAQ